MEATSLSQSKAKSFECGNFKGSVFPFVWGHNAICHMTDEVLSRSLTCRGLMFNILPPPPFLSRSSRLMSRLQSVVL
jgi:hypothetical protein